MVSKSCQKWCLQLSQIWDTTEAYYAFQCGQTNNYTFSRPVHSTALPPLQTIGFLPFFAFLSRSKLRKKGKVAKKLPKIGFSFLAFSQNISNLKIMYFMWNTSFFSTTHNYAFKVLKRLIFTIIMEHVAQDVCKQIGRKLPKNLTLITN